MSRNLTARIIVAAIFGPLIILMGYLGGFWLFGMVTLFATLGLWEYMKAEGVAADDLMFWLSLVTVWLILVSVLAGESYYWANEPALWLGMVGGMALTAFFIVGGLILTTGTLSPRELFWKHARLLWGVCYIGLLYPFVYLVGTIGPHPAGYGFSGGDILLFLFGILWLGDTAAMGIGKWIGRTKLAPTVSPGKSVEGFFAGIAGAVIVGVIMSFWLFESLEWHHILIISIGCSIFGQLGDLVESMWKRSIAIKDSSSIIPGHGGVLDRFDSLLFAAPFMYWYLSLVFVG